MSKGLKRGSLRQVGKINGLQWKIGRQQDWYAQSDGQIVERIGYVGFGSIQLKKSVSNPR
jgi:hypothetical protein